MENSRATSTQYHHFVPRFLLKNFAHPYIPPKGGASVPPNLPNGSSRGRLYRGEPVLNNLDLASEVPEITQRSVKKTFGQADMYRDTTRPHAEQHLVEEMFSQLESEASTICRKITTSFDERSRGLWLSRNERNLLRKFLFLMKYRGSGFHRRFYHKTTTDYDANDKDTLLGYMQSKGFTSPMDVWLDNIKTVINLEMDDESKWITELPKRMYPDDAQWLIMHCQSMYMAICTPSKPEDEFILTDNSYNVHEGPTETLLDPSRGDYQPSTWLSFHEFAPLSPRLMIVLRSFLLPSPLEDISPKVKASRDRLWSAAVEEPFGSDATSLLADLPVHKCRNNYTEMSTGKLQFVLHEDGSLRSSHRFFFSFFPIETNHVNSINGILLDNASVCNSVVFQSQNTFRRTLEWYMTEPYRIGKRVTRDPGDKQLRLLLSLAAIMKKLGSKQVPVWEEVSLPALDNEEHFRNIREELMRSLPSLLQHISDDNPSEFMQLYMMLGEAPS